jgi:arylsulfatase A-like enzyme
VQQLCGIENGKHKVSYRSRAAAEKKRRQSGQESLHVYLCPFGDRNHWHLSHEAPLWKGEQPPSAKTLRRHIEAIGRNIRAQQRRLEQAEKQREAEQEKARRKAEQVQSDYNETVRAVEAMVGRLVRA